MFANFKERMAERLKTLAVPQDPLDKRINDLVDRATSDVLIGPDWATNLELVDVINSNDPNFTLEKATRALNRPLQSQNRRVQLLTITVLETCIKNCRRPFHAYLSSSELFGTLLRIADPPPQPPVSSEVKDRVLCLVEDLAKALEGPYRHAYETLLDNGVDFPVRSAEQAVPLEIPPESAGPSNDISEEDRAAIAAAMAEMASEAPQAPPPQQGPPTGGPPTGGPALVNPAAAAVVAARGHQALSPAAPPGAVPGAPAEAPQAFAVADGATIVKTAVASQELLAEMLQSVQAEGQAGAVREPFISEMADQCKAQRAQLQELLETCTDEVLLAEALGAHESLQSVLGQYEALLAKSPPPPPAPAAAPTGLPTPGAPQHPPGYTLAPKYTLSNTPPPHGPPSSTPPLPTPAFASPRFTLSDDEDADDSLVTKRQAPPPLPTAPVPTIAPPPPSTPAPPADLINLSGSESSSPPKHPPSYSPSYPPSYPQSYPAVSTAVAPAAPAAAATSSGDPLMDEMDRLMMSGTSLHPQHSADAAAAAAAVNEAAASAPAPAAGAAAAAGQPAAASNAFSLT